MTRVLLDANILISYMLHPHAERPITQVVRAGVLGAFTLLLPAALLEEMSAKSAKKPYLAARIDPAEVAQFAAILRRAGETIAAITELIPAVTRDPKDDYLLAYAVIGLADYLLTGDEDLLVLRQVQGVTICSPREFIETYWPKLQASSKPAA